MTARLTFSDDVSAWVRDYATDAARLLGLSQWEIRITLNDESPHRSGRRGWCLAQYRALHARVELSRDIRDDDEMRMTVLHELLHVATAPIDQSVEERIIDELVPEEHRAHARELYLDGLEVAVQRTARALADHLPAPKEDTTCAAS